MLRRGFASSVVFQNGSLICARCTPQAACVKGKKLPFSFGRQDEYDKFASFLRKNLERRPRKTVSGLSE
jgi:hypothetical protein